jgi:hypothetical protein
MTLYLAGGGVFAERFAGTGGGVQWTNYLIIGGRLVGVFIQKADETTATRYPRLRGGRPPRRPPGLHLRHHQRERGRGRAALV